MERGTFRLHADMAVVPQHLLREVSGDVHDHLIARPTLGQVRHERVPVVVPAALNAGFLTEVVPGGLECRYRARGIIRSRLAVREHIPLGRDPQFAPAYASLAVTYDLLGMYEVLAPEESFPLAKAFGSEGLQLDGTLSEAYTARAAAASYWEFD